MIYNNIKKYKYIGTIYYIVSILCINDKRKEAKMIRLNKSMILNRSKYNIVDVFKLNELVNRIDKSKYDYQIITRDDKFEIIINRKLERV